MNIMVLGYGRHGKDKFCEYLTKHFGLTFKSTSLFCAERVAMAYLADRGVKYASIEACYEDRHNHRNAWFKAIAEYNRDDPARLSKAIFEEYDIYCGLRNRRELLAAKQAINLDAVIWVDRSKHAPAESRESCTVRPDDAEYIVDNNGDLLALERAAVELGTVLMRR